MLEIRRGTASRSYENIFFREFARNLKDFFDKHSLDGLLIANSACQVSPNLQIDSLLVTENTICLIDFKNFGGEITIPQGEENFQSEKWLNEEGKMIKGGSHINPYAQLNWQKKTFIWAFHNSNIRPFIRSNKDILNPGHTKKIVCFQKPINLKGSIPGKYEIDFFITDSKRYLETIKDILDVGGEQIKLSQQSFNVFKNFFIAEDFDLTEEYDKSETAALPQSPPLADLDDDGLYPDQKSALKEITEFIKSDTKIFILQGSSFSGKSYMLPFIEDVGFHNGITQIKFFVSSSRVAYNLLDVSDKFESLYSYIYGGNQQEDIDKEVENEDGNQLNLKITPLKKNDDDDKVLYIVEESQLVSDSCYESIDLRYGSGKLLQDFIEFSDLTNSNRKIVFVGDHFQLPMGKSEKGALSPDYFDNKYQLQVNSFLLDDKEDVPPIVKQALIPINGIRGEVYNQLVLDNLTAIKKDNIKAIIHEKIEAKSDFHILAYLNEKVQEINLWIKKSILKNGENLAKQDLVIINNNFKIEYENNPFSEPKKVFNGQFGTIANVSNEVISESAILKGKSEITITFRELEIELNISSQRKRITILSLENYRLSKKGELSEDEIIALKIILNKKIKEQLENNPFECSDIRERLVHSKEYKDLSAKIATLNNRLERDERVKTELEKKKQQLRKLTNLAKKEHRQHIEDELLNDTSSKYYKYKNSAHLRFGWALTVHKSRFYKWDEVLLNMSQGKDRGKTNKEYFRWIYTGLTRAKKSVKLINYEPITPLYNIKFKDTHDSSKTNKEIYFIAKAETADSSTLQTGKFNFPTSITLQIYQFIYARLESKNIEIKSIKHPNYQEIYELKGNDGQTAKVSIYYNAKGQVKLPTIQKVTPPQFKDDVLKALTNDIEISNFDFIAVHWRKLIYKEIYSLLKHEGYHIAHIVQTDYKDEIKIVKSKFRLIVDMWYDGDGFFTSVICTYRNNDQIWDDYKEMLNKLRGESDVI
jgi:hypothetical protein